MGIWGLVGVLAMGCTGCKNTDKQYFAGWKPAEVEMVRFDRSLLGLADSTILRDSVLLRASVEELYETYPAFIDIWMESILGIPAEDTTYFCHVLPEYLTDTLYGFQETNKRCLEVFQDIRQTEQEIQGAFGRITTFYERPLPTVYWSVSGFNSSILMTDDNDIVVGEDMYLGSDYPYYNQVVYDYQKQTMRPECIAADVVSAWLFATIPYIAKESRLLDNMLYRGRIMALLELLLPEEKPWETFGYTREQWEWCERNERAIWGMMLDRKALYTNDPLTVTSYLGDGPFCAEISQEAPARLGTWIGMRIIQSYMKRHPEVSIKEMLLLQDAQLILEESYYKP